MTNANPPAAAAAAAALRATPGDPTRDRLRAEQTLGCLCADVRRAASQPAHRERLAGAGITAALRVAEFPDLAASLTLNPQTVEVVEGWSAAVNADVELTVPAALLDGLWERQVPALILKGSIGYRGPVAKLLRILPILGTASRVPVAQRAAEPPAAAAPSRGMSPGAVVLLDSAAEYRYHSGAPTLREEQAGEFWSIECVDVHKQFGEQKVLSGLDLGIPEGMITVIMGPSGTGKSVLIKHLVGLLFPDKGEVRVHGESVSRMRRSQLLALRQRFGILFQDGALFGSMPLYDNVAFPLRQHTNFSEARIREIVERRLSEVGLAGTENSMPSELSGGMRKRAGFARALVLEPEIVLFDEPDSGLDPVRTALLCELIRDMHNMYGGTYLVITHDVASARQIGDYIAVLWKGRIVEAGTAEEMFASQNPFVRQFLNRAPQGPLGME